MERRCHNPFTRLDVSPSSSLSLCLLAGTNFGHEPLHGAVEDGDALVGSISSMLNCLRTGGDAAGLAVSGHDIRQALEVLANLLQPAASRRRFLFHLSRF